MDNEEFIKNIHRDAVAFRNKKRKEIISKINPSETEREILIQWDIMEKKYEVPKMQF